jgi:hypothetical protein
MNSLRVAGDKVAALHTSVVAYIRKCAHGSIDVVTAVLVDVLLDICSVATATYCIEVGWVRLSAGYCFRLRVMATIPVHT